jgi:glucose-6-phosphate-specific signal transduction histidine kinase
MRVSLWRLLQDIIESMIEHARQFEVTILDQIY